MISNHLGRLGDVKLVGRRACSWMSLKPILRTPRFLWCLTTCMQVLSVVYRVLYTLCYKSLVCFCSTILFSFLVCFHFEWSWALRKSPVNSGDKFAPTWITLISVVVKVVWIYFKLLFELFATLWACTLYFHNLNPTYLTFKNAFTFSTFLTFSIIPQNCFWICMNKNPYQCN